jgi:transposase
MEFFSGLDVSIGETAIYVVDDKGAVHLQTSFPTDGEAIMQVLKPFLARLRRVGHEVGSLSPWLHPELVKRGLPAVCLETQHVRTAMSAQRNKMVCCSATIRMEALRRTGWPIWRSRRER